MARYDSNRSYHDRPQLEELSPDRFREVVDLVRRRREDEEARQELAEAEDIAPAWERITDAFDGAVTAMNTALDRADEDEVQKADFSRPFSHNRLRIRVGADEKFYSPHLALYLGELSRVLRLGDRALAQESLGEVELDDSAAHLIGDERRLQALYPLAVLAPQMVNFARARLEEDREAGLDLDVILEITEKLDQLQDRIGVRKRKNKLTRKNVSSTTIPRTAARLAHPTVLAHDELPRAFQDVYDDHWNVGHAKTRTAKGAFVAGLRGRLQKEGPPELLVVMAASSDGTDREVAGWSDHTPEVVYKKMIYDNALHVLEAVVQNTRFDDQLAYAMMETDLPNQITAVMLHGRVDMGVRVMACERAIKHEGVDPVNTYRFLRSHTLDPNVPDYLWRDFIKELNHRIHVLRAREDEEGLEEFRARLERFAKLAMDDLIEPYWEARKTIARLEPRVAQDEESTNPYERYGAPRRRQQLREQREFVQAHEMLKDPDLLDIILEGRENNEQAMLDLLKCCAETDLPVTDKMTVRLLQHDSADVREKAMRILPNVDNDQVEEMAKELERRILEDFEAVREQVEEDVLPEYEPVAGVARSRNAKKWPHFLAARTHSLTELVETYVHCYETDPKTMFHEFRRLTMRRHLSDRLNRQIDEAEFREFSDLRPLDTEPVAQADLFGNGNMGSEGPSTTVEESEGERPREINSTVRR